MAGPVRVLARSKKPCHSSPNTRFAKITARKARLLTDLIRNRPVGEALDLLKFNKKRGAVLVSKVLKSAIANADQSEGGCRRAVRVQVVLRRRPDHEALHAQGPRQGFRHQRSVPATSPSRLMKARPR